MALSPITEEAIVLKYAELIKRDVEDLVHRYMSELIQTRLELMIQTATDAATKNIAKKLLEIAIADAGKTP